MVLSIKIVCSNIDAATSNVVRIRIRIKLASIVE